MDYLSEVVKVARQSTCDDAKCGCIIIKDDEIIGRGFNSPSGNLENQRRCNRTKDSYHKRVSDKTCCMHAEQRAIMDALAKNPQKLRGSTLYFIRLDKEGNPLKAGKPYCTICSKMALDVGIAGFALWHGTFYIEDTEAYNNKSYEYNDN
jgi:deoxycytidylate deaminase